MAHELDLMANGKYTMARASDTTHSWHNLENIISPDAPFKTWLEMSGMNFIIHESQVEYAGHDETKNMSSRKVLWRDDTESALSIVGSEYKVVQPSTILQFFHDMCAKNMLKMDTAGVIQGGRKFWALARTGLEFNLKNDVVKDYILLATSCDGTTATVGKQTSMRVVCSNTFHANLGNEEAAIKVYHNTRFEEQQMKIDLNLTTQNFSKFADVAKDMNKVHINDTTAKENFLKLLTGIDDFSYEGKELKLKAESSRNMQKLWDSYKYAPGHEPSVWGWFNGVTHYVDHVAGRNIDSRFNNAMFGSGNTLKQNAWKKAMEMVAA